ncbi:MAG: hypothetical protein H0X33_13325 [Taibaiella sp.]|nr:hypothetical protein [Taibaiella sp.]
MTTTKTKKIPTIKATSSLNFYDVLSSDGYTHYPLLVTGPGAIRCGCPAGEIGKSCYHRNFALKTIIYIDEEITYRLAALEIEIQELNQTINNLAETEMEKDAYRDLLAQAA